MSDPPDIAQRLQDAYEYAHSLHSTAKHHYAMAYIHDVVRNGLPEPDRGTLSYMAAQAVRFRIHEIMRGDQ